MNATEELDQCDTMHLNNSNIGVPFYLRRLQSRKISTLKYQNSYFALNKANLS